MRERTGPRLLPDLVQRVTIDPAPLLSLRQRRCAQYLGKSGEQSGEDQAGFFRYGD